MSSLLDKTRKLNRILQKGGTEPVAFEDICSLLSEVLCANVYIISRKGKILGHTFLENFECEIMRNYVVNDKMFPGIYNDDLLSASQTISNIKNKGLCVFEGEGQCPMRDKISTVVPIIGNREKS